MKVYVTVNGLESILGGYLVIALAFYQEELPQELINLFTQIKKDNVDPVKVRAQYKKFSKFADYFHYEYSYIKFYNGLNDYINLRNSAQQLVFLLKHRLGKPITEIIYHKDVPSSIDFPVNVHPASLEQCLPLYLAQLFGAYERSNKLKLISYEYPEYRLTRHSGRPVESHFEDILQHGITSYHHPDTLEKTARYIQQSINKYAKEQMVSHSKLFKSLPSWWTQATGKKTLKEYFTPEELDEIKYHLRWCRKYKTYKDRDVAIAYPIQRPLPAKFNKWLQENKC